jgi:hypothetical protein
MWTDDPLFLPERGEPMTAPYPLLDDDMTKNEIAALLSSLVFTKAKEWRRPVYLTPKTRDKIVNALNLASFGQPLSERTTGG